MRSICLPGEGQEILPGGETMGMYTDFWGEAGIRGSIRTGRAQG